MSKDEFTTRFRGRMLLFLTEAWACRKDPPSQLGLMIDDHALKLRALLGEMYEALCPHQPVPRLNGNSIHKNGGN